MNDSACDLVLWLQSLITRELTRRQRAGKRRHIRQRVLVRPVEAVADAAPAAAVVETRPESRAVALLKSTGLYLAAPFCALACMVATVFVMLGTLGWMAIRPLAKRLGAAVPFLRNVGLFLAASFVGLAYVIAFPFVGAGMLLSRATRALLKRPRREQSDAVPSQGADWAPHPHAIDPYQEGGRLGASPACG